MHDVAGEIACAEGCAETISANVLKADTLGTRASVRFIQGLRSKQVPSEFDSIKGP